MKRRKIRKWRKKASIGGIPAEIFAYFVTAIVIMIFGAFYKMSAAAKMQQIQDKQDVTYGNYLAQAYLRNPLSVAGKDMTVAELISLYDYNQTLERNILKSSKEVDEKEVLKRDELFTYTDKLLFMLGKKNSMRDALQEITEEFVKDNFDDDRCFFFAIHSDSFDFNYKSTSCVGAKSFGIHYLFSYLSDIPTATYKTYIAPVDPRVKPIVLYSIYDFERLLSVYSPDPYFDMTAAQRAAMGIMCGHPGNTLIFSKCRSRTVRAVKEKFTS